MVDHERRHPNGFMKREHHEITGPYCGPVQADDARERLAAKIDAIAQRLAEGKETA